MPIFRGICSTSGVYLKVWIKNKRITPGFRMHFFETNASQKLKFFVDKNQPLGELMAVFLFSVMITKDWGLMEMPLEVQSPQLPWQHWTMHDPHVDMAFWNGETRWRWTHDAESSSIKQVGRDSAENKLDNINVMPTYANHCAYQWEGCYWRTQSVRKKYIKKTLCRFLVSQKDRYKYVQVNICFT